MKNKISEFIENHSTERSIIVLKGYDVEKYGGVKINLADTLKNRLQRLISLSQTDITPIISFDEFLAMYDLIKLQYTPIYILSNPIYHILFPIDVKINDEILDILLRHYDDESIDVEDTKTINSDEYELVKEYLDIYGKIIQTKSGLACCYNQENLNYDHDNLRNIVLTPEPSLSMSKIDTQPDSVQISDDSDYFDLVNDLYKTEKNFSIIWQENYADKDTAQKRTESLQAAFPDRVFFSALDKNTFDIYKNPETHTIICSLLKKYWNYDNFRDLKVYDIDELKDHEKRVNVISQEQIIMDIIEQAEHSVRNETYQDIFVTAPTGAGKSLMFQLPAIYLAEKYNLVTLVITPLIGLMEDQVNSLKNKGYSRAETINSDISPVTRDRILDDLAQGNTSILYLSPESLLSKNDIAQLIGNRKIGMLVVDEAHIVTTWGKQFRPDYWFLGDHVQKLRQIQMKRETNPSPFVIATFTATAIYDGKEDMYHETINSLHLIDPITYLGYIKRENIEIDVKEMQLKKAKVEYEMDKFDDLLSTINLALMRNQKVLIYFPTVALINSFFIYCQSKIMSDYLAIYNGQMTADQKEENMHAFHDGTKKIMAATKAFGMGIDIPDIDIVAHFAPTGNVCDFMQEIGRAARDGRQGYSIYHHMSNDFQHINRFHGLSTIKKFQLIEVQKKILEIFESTREKSAKTSYTRKRNEMLVDTESFSYIFGGSHLDENDLQAKVKTAMLLIQKDYEKRKGFSPFKMRPIPLFAHGFFAIPFSERESLRDLYPGAVALKEYKLNICDVDLESIWEKDYKEQMSFPKFKYLLYSNSKDLDFNQKWHFTPAMSVDITFLSDEVNYYSAAVKLLRRITNESISSSKYIHQKDIICELSKELSVSNFRAENLSNVFLAAIDIYQKEYSKSIYGRMVNVRTTNDEKKSFLFNTAVRDFFIWIEDKRKFIFQQTKDGKLFVVNNKDSKQCSEIITALGLLEAFGTLQFKSLGGSNSQLYLYVNETKALQIVRNRPEMYKNQLLDLINDRHEESVKTMTYLFQNGLSSSDIWDFLENYFLGLTDNFIQKPEPAYDSTINYECVDHNDYESWNEIFNSLFPDYSVLSNFDDLDIPLPDYFNCRFIINEQTLESPLLWEKEKVAITDEDIEHYPYKDILKENGWKVINLKFVDKQIKNLFMEV